MQSKQHWEQVYTTKESTHVSWFQEHARQSMELIRLTGVARNGGIIDVGGGASTLVDDLLADGYRSCDTARMGYTRSSVRRSRCSGTSARNTTRRPERCKNSSTACAGGSRIEHPDA